MAAATGSATVDSALAKFKQASEESITLNTNATVVVTEANGVAQAAKKANPN